MVASEIRNFLDNTVEVIEYTLQEKKYTPKIREVGKVKYVGKAIARVSGLRGIQAEELVRFPGGALGIAFSLDPDEVGIVLLDETTEIWAGCEVRRTGKIADVPVGKAMLGRVVDAIGRPLDGLGLIRTRERRLVEREAPAIKDRLPVTVPLQTGIKVIDALIPIGRGQRELILGDRQTGKTAIALDTIINQKDKGVICVYCAIGQKSSSVAKFIADLNKYEVMGNTIVVAAAGDAQPGLKFIAPYSATAMAEYFMEQGMDVLIVYDDLTRHANAYRELSLLLRRPPGREAFPGDIFYIHSRLLERSTHLKKELNGGSLTALPIVETEAQNISAYIPTNLISITDGQIYLSPELFQKGMMPAVNAGKSVSRVGGKTQFPSYHKISGNLRLSYSQFEELEKFARFSSRLDEATRKTIDRGRRVREILKQPQYHPMPASRQIAILLAVIEGLVDELPLDSIARVEQELCASVSEQLPELCERIESGKKLSDDDKDALLTLAKDVIESIKKERETGADNRTAV